MHQRVIPRVGGIAILIAFIILLFAWRYLFTSLPQLPPKLFSALSFVSLSIFLIGVADDIVFFEIKNKAKFIGELLIASEVVFLLHIYIDEIHLLQWDFHLGWTGIPISIIWLVGVTNSVNIIDGLDGLAGTILLIIFSTIALIAGLFNDIPILMISIILGGLVSGFLINNFSPARVFLGDTGALLLGMICGVLSIYIVSRSVYSLPIILVPMIVGFPILDVFVAMGRRFTKHLLNSRNLFFALRGMTIADNEHIHHRLIYRGLSHTETVIILFFFHIAICMCAVIGIFAGKMTSIITVVYLSGIIFWLLFKLDFVDRLNSTIRKRREKAEAYRDIVGVSAFSKTLPHALKTYRQETFQFQFVPESEIKVISMHCSAVILEKHPEKSIEEMINLAGMIFSKTGCPVIGLIGINDKIPEYLTSSPSDTSFLLLKNPVYIPVVMTELSRLIKQGKGWGVNRITTDTRHFFQLVTPNEEI